jgi:hypothetical protein
MAIGYLDAATGGLVIQTVIAAAVAGSIVMRTQIARGLRLIRGGKWNEEPPGTDETTTD